MNSNMNIGTPVTNMTDAQAQKLEKLKAKMATRYGIDASASNATDVAKPETAPVAPAKKEIPPQERMAKRLNGAINKVGIGIEVSDEERNLIIDFLCREEVLPLASTCLIHLLPEGHRQMIIGLDASEVVLNGDDGIVGIYREDRHGAKILNLMVPALTQRLRVKLFKGTLQVAMRNWIVALKGLQVQSPLNKAMKPEEVIQSDEQYLEKVVERIVTSSVFTQIAEAIGNSPVFDQVFTVPYIVVPENDGQIRIDYLFRTDAERHAKSMALAAENGVCQDLLQGDTMVSFVYGKLMAIIDPDLPSLYLYRGKTGYRPNLYIPEAMLQEWLDVEV